jgi:hypothetical protein
MLEGMPKKSLEAGPKKSLRVQRKRSSKAVPKWSSNQVSKTGSKVLKGASNPKGTSLGQRRSTLSKDVKPSKS